MMTPHISANGEETLFNVNYSSNPVSYTNFVNGLFTNKNTGVEGLLHAGVGASGEAGEFLDAVKKLWVYGASLDSLNKEGQTIRDNLLEELGDMEFYMQAARSLLGVPRDYILLRNIKKLEKRYPNGWTPEAALERADKVGNVPNNNNL